ncbi:hypothetical protein FJT64_000052 [Amphibalanus amphitrite]|uniref:Uncharacterized protein n=1 Tax=Amphibalanus amphitrite TaxID=1232801 RepID=A0A6A4X4W7_AMPAM|nr:hypothetical protein FJT64_000052 [Amphibalanus amphitrite]
MRSRRRRGGGVGSWHSEDGVHLGVPPTRYGAPPAAADGGGRLPRCQSSEDVSSGRRSSGDAASRCRRTQFRLRPLAPASSVGQLDRLQGGRPDRLQGDRLAAGAAAEPAAGGGDAQPWARGSAEERRRLFQRRRARWEPEPAARQAAAPGPGPTVERQDVTTAANCVGLSTKGGGEGPAKHPAGQNGAAPEPGGTVGVSVLLQSWMERLERLSLQQRREEMEGSTTAADGEAVGDEPSDPPSAPATPPTPTGDWVPTFVVSDCSGRSWPAPWSELLAPGGGGGRRLSAVSDCSTVSSAGWDRSRRGSLLDLDTEGLRLDDDGRLERAATHHGSETEPRDGPAATNGQLGTEIDLGTIPGPEDGLRTTSGLEDGLGTTSGLEDGLGTISGPGDGRRRSAETSRKISSWSYSSVSTLSQDEEEEPRTAGPTSGAVSVTSGPHPVTSDPPPSALITGVGAAGGCLLTQCCC